jgi:hypothetical protein
MKMADNSKKFLRRRNSRVRLWSDRANFGWLAAWKAFALAGLAILWRWAGAAGCRAMLVDAWKMSQGDQFGTPGNYPNPVCGPAPART